MYPRLCFRDDAREGLDHVALVVGVAHEQGFRGLQGYVATGHNVRDVRITPTPYFPQASQHGFDDGGRAQLGAVGVELSWSEDRRRLKAQRSARNALCGIKSVAVLHSRGMTCCLTSATTYGPHARLVPSAVPFYIHQTPTGSM